LLPNSYLGDLESHRIQAVKTGDVMEVISHGAVASPLIGYKHAMIRNGDYSAAFMVAQMLKDLSNYVLSIPRALVEYAWTWPISCGRSTNQPSCPVNKKKVSSYIVKAR
jgi:hypothetical protein